MANAFGLPRAASGQTSLMHMPMVSDYSSATTVIERGRCTVTRSKSGLSGNSGLAFNPRSTEPEQELHQSYHVGIIDYLQEFNAKKYLELKMKSLFVSPDEARTISVSDP